MLYKKDFVIIANILNNHYRHVLNFDGYACLCKDFADYLETKNPTFNRNKFLEACKAL